MMSARPRINIRAIALLATGLSVCMAVTLVLPSRLFFSQPLNRLILQPAAAQTRGTAEAASRVYEQLPDLPRANHYIDSRTGEPDPENTFVNRFLRYHLYVRRRPPVFRLDWKLTIADYLGINEWMREEKYPGADLLRTHPMADDQELLRSLNRAERDALVQAIVSIYNPEAFPDASVPAHQEPVPAGSADESDSAPPQITGEPGAADLLLP